MANLFTISDPHHLIFPVLLLVFYTVCWMAVGRDPRIRNIVPQYDPPAGISPGVARYILTGGSDGTTLAAVLAGLASKGVVSIQPQAGNYAVTLLNSTTMVLPDEASLVRTLFNLVLPLQPYADSSTKILGDAPVEVLRSQGKGNTLLGRAGKLVLGEAILAEGMGKTALSAAVARSPLPEPVVIDPLAATAIKYHLGALQDTFRKNLQGVYFSQNFRFAGIGTAVTFAWALLVAATLDASSSTFVTFWLLLFTSISGLVIGGVWTSKPTHPSPRQRVTRVLLPILFFGLPSAMIYFAALPRSHGFVLALLFSVAINNVFFVIMRAPTPRGVAILQQLAGFREFLLRVEQDRLDRVNTPEQRAELMNHFLPFAIALNVREGWGDKMASAFSDAIVER
ncbi:MAG: hypothetical protein JWM08_2960 [Candidatus Angelobacter sp.]|nr:hypothetical protein [Candidatus Angelobacter sp.]